MTAATGCGNQGGVSDKVTEGNDGSRQKQPKSVPSPVNGNILPVEKQWKPGQSGNPGGRPKGASPRAALRRMLAENPNEHGEGSESAAIAARIMQIAKAIAGGELDHDKALKVLEAQLKVLEQVDGKPKETIEHSGDVTVRRVILEDIGGEPSPS
mgnify:FL=1